jgi:hypothetical protein
MAVAVDEAHRRMVRARRHAPGRVGQVAGVDSQRPISLPSVSVTTA